MAFPVTPAPRPFLSPLRPLLLPPPPSCSARAVAALWYLRAVFLLSLTAPGQGPGGGSIVGLPSGDQRHQMAFSPFLPQRVGVSHVSSPAHLVSTAQLPKPRMRLKATGPGVGDRPKRPQSRQRPGPRCSQAWEGEASALRCSSLFFLFHQLSLRLDRTRQLEMLTSAFKTENPTETAVQRSPSQSESRFRDGAEAWPPPG